jgi:phosphoribosylaminoimidazole carboxylase PurE protein
MSTADAPLVGILVGSESDRERMQAAMNELDASGVAWEFEVRSAHRTPDAVAEYAKTARDRGLRVLIAGAGLAAALPGAVAAHTDLPVIGVPRRASSTGSTRSSRSSRCRRACRLRRWASTTRRTPPRSPFAS